MIEWIALGIACVALVLSVVCLYMLTKIGKALKAMAWLLRSLT